MTFHYNLVSEVNVFDGDVNVVYCGGTCSISIGTRSYYTLLLSGEVQFSQEFINIYKIFIKSEIYVK